MASRNDYNRPMTKEERRIFLGVLIRVCVPFAFLASLLFLGVYCSSRASSQTTITTIQPGQTRAIQCANSVQLSIDSTNKSTITVRCANIAATPTPTPTPTATPTPLPLPTPTSGVAEMPRALLDTKMPTFAGKIHRPMTSGEFQSALNSAVGGDMILLAAGVVYGAPIGGFVMPGKANQSGWILIATTNLAQISPEGVRIAPLNSGAMPKLVGVDSSAPVIGTGNGAAMWRLVGLEITHTSASFTRLVRTGAHDSTTNQASDIVIDRCYIHGSATSNTRRGVEMHGSRVAVIDSYISEIHEDGTDSQALCGWNGAGPYKIVNNYLEAASENVMFGGADPAIKNLIPSDIEFRRNFVIKPQTWRNKPWNIKTLFEVKNGQRIWIDGNTFDGTWPAAQIGMAFNLKSVSQDNQAPWSHAGDLTITNNVIRNATGGFSLLGTDSAQPGVPMSRVLIRNNTFDTFGEYWAYINGVDGLVIERNSINNGGSIFQTENVKSSGFVMTGNQMNHGLYGIKGDGFGVGLPTLNQYFPGFQFINNAIIGGNPTNYPAGNFYAVTAGIGADMSAITAAQVRP